MRILCIDTSSRCGSVALTDGSRIVRQETDGEKVSHAERLISSIDRLMTAANWKMDDLQGVVVALGPGSFMGLRTGIATAKGIALSIGCPIAGISSLSSLALNAVQSDRIVVPVIDARRNEVYAAAYKFDESENRKEIIAECVLPPETLANELIKINGEFIFVGDGAIEYRDKLLQRFKERATVASGAQALPQAAQLAVLAKEVLESGGDDITKIVPNYIRRSDAEIGFMGPRLDPSLAGSNRGKK